MAARPTVRVRRRLIAAATILAAALVTTVAAAYLAELNLDDRQQDAVEEHLRANDLLGSVLAEQTALELYFDSVSHQTDGRDDAFTTTFDPESSLQLIGGLLAEHRLLHERYGGARDTRVETIEGRFEAVAAAVRRGAPLSDVVSSQVTWRLVNFDFTSSLTQVRQWHAEAFDLEAMYIGALRTKIRLGLLAILLVGGAGGAIVLLRLLRVLRHAEGNEERARAALRARHRELQHALADARTASEAKTRFVANTSHELRTPLTAIIGFTDVLAEADLDPEQHEHLMQVQSNAGHLLQLVDDVLDISRIEAGEVTATRDEVDVASLLGQVVRDLRRLADGRPVEVVSELPATSGTLLTDRVKLRQIVMNLVGNALKFTERGTVTISLTLGDDGTPRRIDVADTGIGIAPDLIEAVQKPFRQADDERTRRFGGAGLGIPISLGLADLLGHRLTIRSEVGVGSTFSLLLEPLPDPDSEAPLRPHRADDDARPDDRADSMRMPPTPGSAFETDLEEELTAGDGLPNTPAPAGTGPGRRSA